MKQKEWIKTELRMEERIKWVKRKSRCNIDETGALLRKGSQVLTNAEMEEIFGPVHYKGGKLMRDVRLLRKKL